MEIFRRDKYGLDVSSEQILFEKLGELERTDIERTTRRHILGRNAIQQHVCMCK